MFFFSLTLGYLKTSRPTEKGKFELGRKMETYFW